MVQGLVRQRHSNTFIEWMKWVAADSNTFYFIFFYPTISQFHLPLLTVWFFTAERVPPHKVTCTNSFTNKGLFSPNFHSFLSLIYNVTKERTSFKKHSDESQSSYLSCPALTQEGQILLFSFINQTSLFISPNTACGSSPQTHTPPTTDFLFSPLDLPWWPLAVFISPFPEFLLG